MSTNKSVSSGNMIGIDIGSDSIKVSEVVSSDGVLKVTGLGMCKIPEGCVINDDIQEPKRLGLQIKALLKDSGINCKKCVISFSVASRTMTRVLDVPRADSEKQIANSIKYEIERIFPFPSNDTEFDWCEIPQEEDEQIVKAFVAVAHRKLVEDLLRVVNAAGLTLVAIEVPGLAAGRCASSIDFNEESKPLKVAVLNIGAVHTEMNVFDGTTIASQGISFDISGNTLTNAIENSMGLDFDLAEQKKKEYAAIQIDKVESYLDTNNSKDFNFDVGEFDTPFDDPNYNPLISDETFDFSSNYEDESSKFNFDENFTDEETFAEESFHEEEAADEYIESEQKEDFDGQQENVASDSQENVSGDHNSEEANDILMSILPSLLDLSREVRVQLEEYYNVNGSVVDKLILSGGTSKIPGIAMLFERQVGLKTGLVYLEDKFGLDLSAVDTIEDIRSLYPTSIGLAVRNFIE